MNEKKTNQLKNKKKMTENDSMTPSGNIHVIKNKTDIPDNIIISRNETIEKCTFLERQMPSFLKDYFLYLKNHLSIQSRLAYLSDLKFFLDYLLLEHALFVHYSEISEIRKEAFCKLTAKDINYFIGEYASRYYIKKNDSTYIYENHNRSLSRKKSSLSVLFKFLFRNGDITENISEGFNPIKLPKPHPDSIKKLEVEEMNKLIEIVDTGIGLTAKELQYWSKTKLRDKAIILMFLTYGLRISELVQLDLASINTSRGEFKIYRKRGKESVMPLNNTIRHALQEYLNRERGHCIEIDEPLFLSLQGKRLTTRAVRELVNKYTSLAMGTSRKHGYSPHKLRATAASTLIEFGFSIYDVQNLLDHDNITTTQLYAAHKKNSKKDLIRQFELDHPTDT